MASLWKVQVPQARRSFLTAVNQTVMMCLSMVVVGALIGAGGLGGALLAGALWESAGAAITFSAASALALAGLTLVWRGVPGESTGAPVR